MRAYGHGSRNELEISLPRLSEEPRNIERFLHDLAGSGRQPSHEFQEQQRRRRDAERDVRRRLEAQGASKAELRAFFADLRLAQTFLPLRETIKHYYTGEYRVLRETLLEINRRLGWKDGDIFYLDPSEISGCFHSCETLAALVSPAPPATKDQRAACRPAPSSAGHFRQRHGRYRGAPENA